MSEKSAIFIRRIRSFVKRDGRLTKSQQMVYEKLWPQYGLALNHGMLSMSDVFQCEAPLVLEIGFGSGQSLLEMAKLHPEENYIGIEMYKPGIGALLMGVMEHELTNLRLFHADAVEVLSRCIPDHSLDVVQIFFPDPWQKRKHHKRRLIQPEFIALLATKLKSTGLLHLATDWEDYAVQMMRVMTASPAFVNLFGDCQYAERSLRRPLITKFENRGRRAGRNIWELQFVKNVKEVVDA